VGFFHFSFFCRPTLIVFDVTSFRNRNVSGLVGLRAGSIRQLPAYEVGSSVSSWFSLSGSAYSSFRGSISSGVGIGNLTLRLAKDRPI